VCKWTRLAARRHLDDLKRTGWGYYFSDDEANRVCGFVEELPHVEGEWDSPTIQLEDWQVFLLAVVFGWRRDSDGLRRFNTAYIELARKNGKSAISSAVALYCLCCEGEVGPQVKTAATTGDQARIVFDVACKMVQGTFATQEGMAEFREHYGVEAMANSIPCMTSGGNIKPINAKASAQDGLNPHLTIIDELHAHKDRALFDVLKSARGARKNPLSWYVTTAGYNVQGVCYEQRTLLTKILDGVVDMEHFFGIIYTLDEGDSEFNPAVWQKPNPNLGVSVNLEEFSGYADEAKLSPDSHAEFKTKRCNIWTSARDGWVNIERWKLCNGAVDLDELVGVPCYMGVDLASTTDITAVQLVWYVDDRVKTWGRYYLPEDAVKPRTERGNVPYQRWEKTGHLTTTPGNVTDYAYIEGDIKDLLDRFDVQEIAYDPWNASDLVNRLAEDGAPMVEFRQGPKSYNAGMLDLERHYIGGTLDHGGNPVLTWMVSNLVARKDVNGNMAPDKKHSEEKIDGIVAHLMGHSRALVHKNAEASGPLISVFG